MPQHVRREASGEARLRDRGQIASEVPRRRRRLAPHEAAGNVGELRDVHQPLDRVGLRGEHLLAAEADPLDQAVYEAVGRHLLERAAGRPVDAQEGECPVTPLGRELR